MPMMYINDINNDFLKNIRYTFGDVALLCKQMLPVYSVEKVFENKLE